MTDTRAADAIVHTECVLEAAELGRPPVAGDAQEAARRRHAASPVLAAGAPRLLAGLTVVLALAAVLVVFLGGSWPLWAPAAGAALLTAILCFVSARATAAARTRRWGAAYRRLAASPHRARGRLTALDIRWDKHDRMVIAGGQVAYTDASGTARYTPFSTAPALRLPLPPEAAPPAVDAPVTVWHTPGHDVVLHRLPLCFKPPAHPSPEH
ncbi:hypothetical protein [Sediminivirga luteola]|uniref:Uncharacterized protein n=1 Tax=Sediminivirga luteola TaxID=1774748 RepID=A0A8J2TXU2_9MICO|nr:hypothetical protein [Sediminivirga luteola]MCI2265855.1 hypothetical protein [Sediminivirga luteola]GGA14113.1 hypothetical protein GCM10011333_16250 [Sediminivirga luteola]